MIISTERWSEILQIVRRNPATRWRIDGDDGFSRCGCITHLPLGPPEVWEVTDKIHVGDGSVGESILLGHIRAIAQESDRQNDHP